VKELQYPVIIFVRRGWKIGKHKRNHLWICYNALSVLYCGVSIWKQKLCRNYRPTCTVCIQLSDMVDTWWM